MTRAVKIGALMKHDTDQYFITIFYSQWLHQVTYKVQGLKSSHNSQS